MTDERVDYAAEPGEFVRDNGLERATDADRESRGGEVLAPARAAPRRMTPAPGGAAGLSIV